jgi:(E)-4-hydroxy-3-methylbut-2-enyl-diphosphate synthase
MNPCIPRPAAPAARRRSLSSQVGRIAVGGDAPVVVQSMTNTDTADVASTTKQAPNSGARDRNWFGSR